MPAANSKGTGKKVGKPFEKGQSGNPSGRPKIPDDIKETFKKLTPKAIERLEQMINDPKTDYKVLIQAINTVLDRAYGKPTQAIDTNVNGDIRIVLEGQLEEWAK